MSDSEYKFRNYYNCPYDDTSWIAEWSCQCNDRCPTCGAEIEPNGSEDIDSEEPRSVQNEPPLQR